MSETMKHTPYVVIGNWKMNPKKRTEALSLVGAVKKNLRLVKTEVVFAPPFPFLGDVHKQISGSAYKLAGQDVSMFAFGAYTGSVSASMLKDVGATFVIIGHSEVRKTGRTDAELNASVKAVLEAKLVPVVCIGESVRDPQGDFFNVVENQIISIFKDIPASAMAHMVIAYEPVWAIGSGVNATPEDILEMKLFIQKTLVNLYGRAVAHKPRILYGGSVNQKNAAEILEIGVVNGFLVGGASLKSEEFRTIIKLTEQHAKNTTSS